ncbi:protein trichome birefringence-like 4 [Solanum lycopersicum]|uniref:protein trichome birefringence-like 4 n=1 Tax=Solanum lycopersicum TaxID=4081 RepID=UPI0002BCC2D8|nr:protein trichome birefringence-like 4 [Solanum lycopersicum]
MADSPPTLPITRKQSSFPPPPLQIRDYNSPRMSELRKSLFSPSLRTPTFRSNRKSLLFLAYVFTFLFVTCATFFVFNNPSINHSFRKILNSRRSHFSTIFSHYFHSDHQNSTLYSLPFTNNDSSISHNGFIAISPSQRNDYSENGLQSSIKNDPTSKIEEEEIQKVNLLLNSEKNDHVLKNEGKSSRKREEEERQNVNVLSNSDKDDQVLKNEGKSSSKREEEERQNVNVLSNSEKNDQVLKNEGKSSCKREDKETSNSEKNDKFLKNEGKSSSKREDKDTSNLEKNDQVLKNEGKYSSKKEEEERQKENVLTNSEKNETRKEAWWEVMNHCDVFDGMWVKDDANPMYEPGSCPFIDEPFDCYQNGRPDNGYQNFRWQPKHCSIPRLDAKQMLELLRGKRLVYVGDSLNRNMWESMVCLLRNSVEDKNRVFEVSGREDFKKEGAYSFIFADYNCSVEFVRSTFLVQEWEIPDGNGSTKETLRLDLVERSCDKYKGADVLVFNTGHWWTHEKTSEGKGYYQEGSHVYGELNVVEAFRKAMTTWARWIEANVDPSKTDVFFRGYSVSHFSGGEWYAGGKCDSDTEPLKDEKDLSPSLYPPIMGMLEDVIKWMKSPVYYLNVTIMSDFRKDGHPSIYRKPNMTDEERRTTLRFQDCSHWCLPGVPDTWNELLYAQLLMKHYQKQHKQQQQQIGS